MYARDQHTPENKCLPEEQSWFISASTCFMKQPCSGPKTCTSATRLLLLFVKAVGRVLAKNHHMTTVSLLRHPNVKLHMQSDDSDLQRLWSKKNIFYIIPIYYFLYVAQYTNNTIEFDVLKYAHHVIIYGQLGNDIIYGHTMILHTSSYHTCNYIVPESFMIS